MAAASIVVFTRRVDAQPNLVLGMDMGCHRYRRAGRIHFNRDHSVALARLDALFHDIERVCQLASATGRQLIMRITGGAFTVKRYRSKKLVQDDGTWQHEEITLEPLNMEFQPIVLTAKEEGDVLIAAEFVGALR